MKLRNSLLAGLVACGLAGSALAQVATTGTVNVIVEDEAGARVPGAAVVAESKDTTTRREAITNSQGEALLVSLEPSAYYTVSTKLAGFAPQRHEGVLVRTGQTATVRVGLKLSTLTEEVTVTGEVPVVDTTSAVTGQDITLDLTESLPTGRSYQSYLQLVPGVLPDVNAISGGNPGSKSGIAYSDIFGDVGASTDNYYYIDGINVTDGVSGTFGANLNTEIIQEQKVITGGIPAEFVGAAGLVSNVVTKSGSNDFHGSANYFFQNSGLVADNENLPSADFSTYDAAATLGGPLVKDKVWFFGSYRKTHREDDVVSNDTRVFLRSVKRDDKQAYGKLTFAPTANDTLSVTFLSDPTELSGRNDATIPNNRDRAREQGGRRFKASYSRLFGPAIVDLAWSEHDGEVSDFSALRESSNTVIFRRTDTRTLADEQEGGFGQDVISERDTRLVRGGLQWNLDRHIVKAGVEFLQNRNFRDTQNIGDSVFFSLAARNAGVSAGAVAAPGAFTQVRFNPLNTSDFAGFINTVNAAPNRAAFYGAYDLNRDGVIAPSELASALTFSSGAGNPTGELNYYRQLQTSAGSQETKSKAFTLYLQDTFTWDRLTVNAGVRAEQYKHVATTGEEIFTFDWTLAPRVSLTYDIKGDGKQKISAYYGKYYDPLRNNLTNFAGTLSGRVIQEQVFSSQVGDWVTFRTRGGPVVLDAAFAPNTKTPWTDDIQLEYQIDLGRNMSMSALATKRRTRDIVEDYDMALYSFDAHNETIYPGPQDHPDSLFLPLDYFGYTGGSPNANFVLMTLAGGERDYKGLEFTFRKRYADRWQMLTSYTYNDSEGNTNSDSNADFQGDDIFLDPRGPNAYGRQPGSVTHLFKVAGSFNFDMGLELGGTYNWNSGAYGSRTFLAFSRHLPLPVATPFEFAGFSNNWIAPDSIGTIEHPSFGTFDLRVKYEHKFGDRARGEFFVDCFNVMNDQGATLLQDLVAGSGGLAFLDEIKWVQPRRFFLGARLSF